MRKETENPSWKARGFSSSGTKLCLFKLPWELFLQHALRRGIKQSPLTRCTESAREGVFIPCSCSSGSTYLSTRVRITANVSSTNPSTFCFFLLGSWGPRPRRGGLTGSLKWLLVSGTGILLFSAWRLLDSTLSSAPLSSRQTQELPMLVSPKVCSKQRICCSRVSRKPWRRLLLT